LIAERALSALAWRVDADRVGAFAPYRGRWELAGARRFFDLATRSVSVSVSGEHEQAGVVWREVTFAADPSTVVTATVVSPLGQRVTRGAVLAHGGTDGVRRFFLSEAAAMAAGGAIVILPVTRMRPQDGIDIFAATVRTAVLTERAALDVLVEMGAPPDTLCFLGHSAGGFLGAILAAVEPRLARIVIFSYGAGTLIRTSLATTLSCGGPVTNEMTCAADWFDAARFVAVDRRAELPIQHGRRDRDVPVDAGRKMFDAAAQPKLWLEYDWDHGLASERHKDDRAKFVLKL